MKIVSQKEVRDNIGWPEFFKGGVTMTTNGKEALYICTAEERQTFLQAQAAEDKLFQQWLEQTRK